MKDKAKEEEGGIKSRRVRVGETLMVTIGFEAALASDLGIPCRTRDCQAWSVEMKGMGLDGRGKGLTTTTTPEPTTILLLATGLALIALAKRRRREGSPGER